MGRIFIVTGLVILLAGLVMTFGDKLPVKLGRLPGDFTWRSKNTVFYFPLATSILLSVVLTVLLAIFNRR